MITSVEVVSCPKYTAEEEKKSNSKVLKPYYFEKCFLLANCWKRRNSFDIETCHHRFDSNVFGIQTNSTFESDGT